MCVCDTREACVLMQFDKSASADKIRKANEFLKNSPRLVQHHFYQILWYIVQGELIRNKMSLDDSRGKTMFIMLRRGKL